MNIITQTEKIYNHLCDDLSRNIFENRLLYSLTGNYNFINNVASSSFGESTLKEYKDALYSHFEKYSNNDIIVYGAGSIGARFIGLCDKIKVAAFCDSDINKQAHMYMGYRIISPMQLKQEYRDAVVVIAVFDEKAVVEITESLLNLGINKDSILNFNKIFRLNNLNTYHLREGKAQYFDPDIILSRFTKDEVFIDGGCCDCQTDILFAENCNNEYKKIIAFEPNPKQYPICVENSKAVKNITIHPYGLWNENSELSFDNKDTPSGGGIFRMPQKEMKEKSK